MNLEVLKDLHKYVQIAHHVPGRIRLKFDPSLAKHPGAGDLLNSKEKLTGIKNIRVNPAARSVVIEYDEEVIRPDYIQELFTVRDPDRFHAIIDELAERLKPQAHK